MNSAPDFNKFPHLLIIGLTGGIGSGKSTVAEIFARYGAVVIDADKMVSHLFQESSIQQKLKETFGEEIFDSNGLNRMRLSEKVFSNSDKKQISMLTNILHPPVREKIWNTLKDINQASENKTIVILDVPLLLESPFKEMCQYIIFIEAPYEKRLERVKNRGWNESELQKRENFQMPLEEKRKLSHIHLFNMDNRENLEKQVAQFWATIK